MKKWILQTLIITLCTAAFADEVPREESPEYYPLAYGDSYNWEDFNTWKGGAGLIFQKGDSLQIVALSSGNSLSEPSSGNNPERYGNLDMLLQRDTTKHKFFSLFKSYSDSPVIGGLETLTFVNGYGYKLVSRGNHTFWAGASLAIGDWGNEIPLMPLPFLHYDYTSPYVDVALDFTTSPMLDIIFAPRSRVRLNSSFLLTDASELPGRGLKYDISGEYRFFDESHPMGDFAGVGVGILADDYEAVISGEKDRQHSVAWKALYGTLDLSLLELTGGYLLEGTEYAPDGSEQDLGDGFYASLQLAYAF